jgi:hypothetical protein
LAKLAEPNENPACRPEGCCALEFVIVDVPRPEEEPTRFGCVVRTFEVVAEGAVPKVNPEVVDVDAGIF